MKLLMIDNYDSFTYNLVQYFGELGAQVEVFRNDTIHKIGFERGKTAEPLHKIADTTPTGPTGSTTRRTGTKVTFKPDPQIFPETEFSFATLSNRLRELAYLNPGVTIRITDERGESRSYRTALV